MTKPQTIVNDDLFRIFFSDKVLVYFELIRDISVYGIF